MANYGVAKFDFYPREKVSTSYFSSYRKFFRGTKWELMALPERCKGQFRGKLQDEITENNKKLLGVPAVYELAVSLGLNSKKYKVYIGKSIKMKRRDGDYQGFIENKDAEHVHEHINHALTTKGGLFLFRRIRYIIPKEHIQSVEALQKANIMSHKWESRILAKYNYAWNKKDNGNEIVGGLKKGEQKIDHTRDAEFGYECCNCLFPKVKFTSDKRAENLYKIAKF